MKAWLMRWWYWFTDAKNWELFERKELSATVALKTWRHRKTGLIMKNLWTTETGPR